MEDKHIEKIAGQLNLDAKQVTAVAELLGGGSTVPFIARYRKEATGSLDEVAITQIRDMLEQLAELDKRRAAILESLEKQGHLSKELKEKVLSAETMAVLEDIYLPFRPKKRTRATIAREKGLEPLAKIIFRQEKIDLEKEVAKFINSEKEINSAEEALAGARDIIAEWISENTETRSLIRDFYRKQARYVCKVITGKEEQAVKYKDYYDWEEPVNSAPSHRVLAMRRGAKEKFLLLRVAVDQEKAISLLNSIFVKNTNDSADQVALAVTDSFKRLISMSIAAEIRLESKKSADEQAIKVFAENLRQLLLSPPLGQKSVLAIDPAFRTGCKIVCLDRQGKLVYHDVIHPLNSDAGAKREAEKIIAWCDKYNIEAVAIGNGTASRETEQFVRGIGLDENIHILMVNESGASVYSASEAAREEFPDHDITVRGAVSIGRRLMDPLAELVKIDPKSIGVGQYQHDVDQTLLKRSLDDTVSSCVNAVGVEVNTASKQLLTYVSGVGPKLAESIVKYREENGAFISRQKLKEVGGLGDKTFQQCAGFLRVSNSENPLDASAVHPESYPVVNKIAADLNCSVKALVGDCKLQQKIKFENYITDSVGMPTLMDIKSELNKPGRDPREKFELFSFAEGINTMEDLEAGMELPGVVTNITAFGAFVDIGVHQDGLVHVSELADRFVKDPGDVVKVHQKVKVRVLEVDIARKRISMSMKKNPPASGKKEEKNEKLRPKKKEKKQNRPAKTKSKDKPSGGSLASQLTLGS